MSRLLGVSGGFVTLRCVAELGYARVSTPDQDLALQLDALEAAGCARVFSETASGARSERPQLERLFDQLLEGDTLVVWRLDRLGRSLSLNPPFRRPVLSDL